MVPAPAHQRRVGDVTHPDLIGARGRGLAQQPVLGHQSRWVGLSGTRVLGATLSARCLLARSQLRSA